MRYGRVEGWKENDKTVDHQFQSSKRCNETERSEINGKEKLTLEKRNLK